MPAATTKGDLIAITEKEWAKLAALIDAIPEDRATASHEDGTIRDIVIHRAHWTELFFQWLAEGASAEMPDHGVKWNQLISYNAALKDRYASMSWADGRAWLRRSHERLKDWIAEQDEAVLYGGPMPGGNGWTTGRYAEASGASHYRSAAKVIRAMLREVSPG